MVSKQPNIFWRRKWALIMSEIAISINTAVLIMFFITNPIIFGMEYVKDIKVLTAIGIFAINCALYAHFIIVDFALLKQDWKWPCIFVTLWIITNIIFNFSGLGPNLKEIPFI
jgi:hypothetical protein